MTTASGLIQELNNKFFRKRVINGQNVELEINYTEEEEGDFFSPPVTEDAQISNYSHVDPDKEISAQTESYINDITVVELIAMIGKPEYEPA